MEERKNWVVMVRVDVKAGWCCYGPATHREAIEFRKRSVGTGIECYLSLLMPLPMPRTQQEPLV